MPKALRVAVALAILCTIVIPGSGGENGGRQVHAAVENKTGQLEGTEAFQADSYDSYLQQHQDARRPDHKIVIHGSDYSQFDGSMSLGTPEDRRRSGAALGFCRHLGEVDAVHRRELRVR